jgi:hypothetical protein
VQDWGQKFWMHVHTSVFASRFVPPPPVTGDIARRHIKDPQLLGLIDAECFVFSTVPAAYTPMINAGMVLSDRFYGKHRCRQVGSSFAPNLGRSESIVSGGPCRPCQLSKRRRRTHPCCPC